MCNLKYMSTNHVSIPVIAASPLVRPPSPGALVASSVKAKMIRPFAGNS